MVRTAILILVLGIVVVLGFRDWFWSLCALIVMTAMSEQHNFRDNIMDITGAKPWNILMGIVLVQWMMQRSLNRGLPVLPTHVKVMVWTFLGCVVWGTIICLLDWAELGSNPRYTYGSVIIDEIVNPLKVLVPALLVFDACRNTYRVKAVLWALVAAAALYSLMVIKYIPVSSLLDAGSVLQYRMRIHKEIGLHPNDIVFAIGQGFWVTLLFRQIIAKPQIRMALVGLAGISGIALLLTQSRTGMATLVAMALLLGVLKYHKFGLMVLACSIVVMVGLPSITSNWSRGFGQQRVDGSRENDINEVTNGRVELWEWAMHDIEISPILGNGRYFWDRHTLRGYKLDLHPHNAYLAVWVDSGILVLIAVLVCFIAMSVVAVKLLRRGQSQIQVTIGAMATVCVFGHFFTGIGGWAFMPRMTITISYCVFALALRMYYGYGALAAPAVAVRVVPQAVPRRVAMARMRNGGVQPDVRPGT